MVLTKDSFVEPRPRSPGTVSLSPATDDHRPLHGAVVDPSICFATVGQPLPYRTSTTSLKLLRRPKHRTFLLTLLFVFLGSYCLLPLVYKGTTHYWSSVVHVDINHVASRIDRNTLLRERDSSRDAYRRFAVDGNDGIEVNVQVDEEWEPSLATKRRVRFPRTKRRLPQCIIIGVRKCGTRALLEFLNIHPLIVKATQEVHFFDDDSRYSLGLEWYRRRMPYSFVDQITVEKSPSYFVTRHVPERIAAMNRNARLLLIVREPVTRAVSDYAQIAAHRAEKQTMATSTDSTTTTTAEWRPPRPAPSRRSGRWGSTKVQPSFEAMAVDEVSGDVNADYRALQISMYANYLQPWFNVFPRRQIHVIDGDRLVVDPLTELRLIEDFLGLEHRISADNFYFNRTKGFYCVRNETAEKCLSGAKGRPHPSVPAHVVDKLRRFFAPHNDRFFDMVGRNFTWTTNRGRADEQPSTSNSTSDQSNEVT